MKREEIRALCADVPANVILAVADALIEDRGKDRRAGGENLALKAEAAIAAYRRTTAETTVAAWPSSLTPELRALLGMMCFELGPVAHRYRAAGEFVGTEGELKSRAEDEQAFMLHKLLGFWFADPARWGEAALKDLDRVKATLCTQAQDGSA